MQEKCLGFSTRRKLMNGLRELTNAELDMVSGGTLKIVRPSVPKPTLGSGGCEDMTEKVAAPKRA
jgi:hypothetical protein